MPIYEYRCTKCGHELDALQKISDEPLKVCPACNESTLKKKVSAAAFRLKGSGWYETDFKSGKKRNVSADDAGTSSDGSADAKPSAGGSSTAPDSGAKSSDGPAGKTSGSGGASSSGDAS